MQELKELGLSENEIAVYITLLKLGLSSANRVAQVSGLKRSTTYDNLNLLVNRGIVSMSKKDLTHMYLAVEPKNLTRMLKDKLEKIQSIVPELESLQQSSISQGGVTYFEGKKGVLTVLNDVLSKAGKKFYYFGSRKMAKIPLKHYPDNFVRRRIQAEIFVQGKLAEEDKEDSFLEDAKARDLSKFAYDKNLNQSKAILFIYANKAAFITTKQDPVGVIIENQEIADFLFSMVF